MEPWVLVTILAAAVQTLRFVLQKRLKRLGLSDTGATFARFLFAAPLAALALTTLLVSRGDPLPPLSGAFWVHAILGGLCQILATLCTVAMFSERAFAVGIAFTKTETVQVAAFSALILAEPVSAAGLVAILVGTAGLVVMSRPAAGWRAAGRGGGRVVALGLGAGGLFGLSAIGYRAATLEIGHDDALTRALVALACVTAFQVGAMAVWMRLRQPGEVGRVLRVWRPVLPVGVTGVLGSLGWFTAFAMQNAAYVRAVGQIELIFSVAASVLFFRERLRRSEVAGILLIGLSIVGIVLLR
ncbi:MAG: EamA family transporter [Gemmobacter sp.]